MNRNVTATISHKENMKSKKIHCLVLMTKYIKKNNGNDGLALGYQSQLQNTATLITNQKGFFVKHIFKFFFSIKSSFLSSILL